MSELNRYLLKQVVDGKLDKEKAAEFFVEREMHTLTESKSEVTIVGMSDLDGEKESGASIQESLLTKVNNALSTVNLQNGRTESKTGVFTGYDCECYHEKANSVNYAKIIAERYRLKGIYLESDITDSSSYPVLYCAVQGIEHKVFTQAIVAILSGKGEICVIVLKSLEEAEKDGDFIYAKLSSMSLCVNGKQGQFYLPDIDQHKSIICDVWKKAGIAGDELSYIDVCRSNEHFYTLCEIEAINQAYGKMKEQAYSLTETVDDKSKVSGIMDVLRVINAVHSLGDKVMSGNTEESTLQKCGIDILTQDGVDGHIILEEYSLSTKTESEESNKLLEREINQNKEQSKPSLKELKELCAIVEKEIGEENLDIDENYFTHLKGAESCLHIFNQITERYHLKWGLSDYLKRDSIRKLVSYVSDQKGKEDSMPEFCKVAPKEYYPLLPAQKMILIHQFMKQDTAYNIPRILYLEGKVDKEKLDSIFRTIIQRHHALRISFHLYHGEYMQRVNEETAFSVEYADGGQDTMEETIQKFLRPFQLDKAPLFRAKLVSYSETRHVLLIDMHHIISDRKSIVILMKEFQELYNNKQLPDVPYQYEDYVNWYQQFMESEIGQQQEEYWLNQFEDGIPTMELALDYPKNGVLKYTEKTNDYEFSDDYRDRLIEFCKGHGITLNMLMLSAFHILLWKWLGTNDVVTGATSQGRTKKEVNEMIGMFVNTLTIRSHPNEQTSFYDFLNQIKEIFFGAYENQEYPFDVLTQKLRSKYNQMEKSLINTLFIMQNVDYTDLDLGALKVKPYHDYIAINGRFDLQVNIFNSDEKHLNVCFIYSKELFKEETIRKLLNRYLKILDQAMASNQDMVLNDFDIE